MAAAHGATSQCGCDSESCPIEVTLKNKRLWRKFYDVGNEMLFNRVGKRLFPEVKVEVRSLDPEVIYSVMMEIAPYDENRYRYNINGWRRFPANFVSGSAFYLHPDSPAPGMNWMKKSIDFHTVKITNNPMACQKDVLVLQSMQKYIVRIHIVQGHLTVPVHGSHGHIFSLPLTTFITVRNYYNNAVSNLKVENNIRAGCSLGKVAKEMRSTSDKEKLNKSSDEDSTELPTKNWNPPPQPTSYIQQAPVGNCNLVASPVLSVQVPSGSNVIQSYPIFCSLDSEAVSRSSNSSTSDSILFSSEDIRPPSYTSYSNYPNVNLHVSPTEVLSNSYLPQETSNAYSSSDPLLSSCILSDAVHHPPDFNSSYLVQTDIFNQAIEDLTIRLSDWTEDRQ